MNQIFKFSGASLYLLFVSPVVYGHLGSNHSSGVNGLIHMITDPVHVSILVVCVVLPLLVVWRKRIILLLERVFESIFRF